jgi:hypothetical protein
MIALGQFFTSYTLYVHITRKRLKIDEVCRRTTNNNSDSGFQLATYMFPPEVYHLAAKYMQFSAKHILTKLSHLNAADKLEILLINNF